MAGQGDAVGGYTLARRLGSGGMGTVWEARDPSGAAVALKLLHPGISADPDSRARLEREVASLNRLRGHHVARVLDAEIGDDLAFIVTELVDGLSLEESVRQEGAFHPVDLYPLADGLAAAVREVHRAKLLHRDIKPGNVMVTYDGPVLIDFGIAQLADDARLTHTGFVTGTPGYLDPAMLHGGGLGRDGDWYGLSAVLLFAATGRAPFGTGRMDVVLARMATGAPDVDGLDPGVAAAFRAALAPEPAARPEPARLLEALRLQAEGLPVPVPSPAAVLPPPPVVAGVAGGTGVTGVAGVAPVSYAPRPPVGPAAHDGVVPAWAIDPPARPGLVAGAGAVASGLSMRWPGVAICAVVIVFVLLTLTGMLHRRTRRRRLEAGPRRSDGWVGAGLALPLLVPAVLTAVLPLLIGAVVAASTWWLGANLVLTDVLGTLPDGLEPLIAPLALAAGLATAWWVPVAEVTREGARVAWSRLAPSASATRIWLLAGAVLVLVLVVLGLVGPIDWAPLPAPPQPGG